MGLGAFSLLYELETGICMQIDEFFSYHYHKNSVYFVFVCVFLDRELVELPLKMLTAKGLSRTDSNDAETSSPLRSISLHIYVVTNVVTFHDIMRNSMIYVSSYTLARFLLSRFQYLIRAIDSLIR